jgi:uncharacterized membrane protein
VEESAVRKHEPVVVVASVYPDREHAKVILDMLQEMHRAATITLKDAALITKDEAGKIRMEETHEVTTRKGAKRGAIVTGILGVIYPPSLLGSLAVGGAVGGLMGRLRDTGIKLSKLESIASELSPGKAAIVSLVDLPSQQATERAMAEYGGHLVVQPLDEDQTNQLLGVDQTDAQGNRDVEEL